MRLYSIVLKNMRKRSFASFLTIVSIALGVALVSAILLVRTEAEHNFHASSTGWDLIVGPKGSSLELVLNAVFNLTLATNTVPYSTYEDLEKDERVDFAVPFCSGDSYQGFRVVATSPAYFEKYEYAPGTTRYEGGGLVTTAGKKLLLAEGEPWKGELGEAVIGSFVAKNTRLGVGSRFVITHGINVEEEMRHAHAHEDLPFVVTGVMEATGTPVDKAIYVSLATWFSLSGHVNVEKGLEAPPPRGRWEETTKANTCTRRVRRTRAKRRRRRRTLITRTVRKTFTRKGRRMRRSTHTRRGRVMSTRTRLWSRSFFSSRRSGCG